MVALLLAATVLLAGTVFEAVGVVADSVAGASGANAISGLLHVPENAEQNGHDDDDNNERCYCFFLVIVWHGFFILSG